MSKAFAGESDDEGEIPSGPPLPPGVRNYMTQAGADKLKALVRSLSEQRQITSSGVEGQASAQKIERQLRFWLPRLEVLEPIDPTSQPSDRVLFGATVMIKDDKGQSEIWRIVGLDETNLNKGWISWMSPLASALLDKHVGDTIPFMDRRLRITAIRYEAG
jgi:transcription elongation factor GreB